MPAIGRAVHVVLAGAALGIIGQLLFFEVAIGINFPIAIAFLVTSGWLLRRTAWRVERRDLWLAPASVVFAAFAAIRADTVIVLLDALTALGLAGGALASYGQRSVLRRSFGDLVALGFAVAGWVGAGAVAAIGAARRRMPVTRGTWGRARPALPVLRGMLIALPVLLVFVSLFSAADAVFARMVDDALRVDLDLGSLPARATMAAVIGWLAIGGLALAASRAPASAVASGPAYDWRLGRTEVLTVLVAVDLLFAAFAALQGAYLFGGLDTLSAIGMTYSEYARRGFFELVAVVILAGGLIVAAERLVRQRSRAVLAAAVGLAGMTAIVLVSAALRLRLYQEAYGWTELRLYVLATIVLLAGVLGALMLALLTDRVRWIGHAVLGLGLLVGLGLSVLGPARFITEQNVARVLDPTLVPAEGQTGIDTAYVLSLGDDRIPDMVRVLPGLTRDEATWVRDELSFRLHELRTDPSLDDWRAWNLGRVRALAALEAAEERGELD
jgi:hypothetical protein